MDCPTRHSRLLRCPNFLHPCRRARTQDRPAFLLIFVKYRPRLFRPKLHLLLDILTARSGNHPLQRRSVYPEEFVQDLDVGIGDLLMLAFKQLEPRLIMRQIVKQFGRSGGSNRS